MPLLAGTPTGKVARIRAPNETWNDSESGACLLGTGYQVLTVAYSALIFDKNSPLVFVLLNLSISNSIASTGDSGFSTFRSTQIRDKSSRGISNSSLRVPDRSISIAGNTRLSTSFRSRLISEL